MNSSKAVADAATSVATPTTTPIGTPATLPTAGGGQSWKVQTQGRKLAVMWAIIAILGIVLISLTTGVPRLLIPVVLLGTYAWYGYRYVETAGELVALRYARVGQLADSLYFLGFLWTLFALIDSFVIHQISIAESVFRAFGYALVTTATGMFLRLLLLQFGYSAEDQAQLGELSVEEQISRFTNEVTRAVDNIRDFHTRTDVALTGWIDSLNKSTAALKTGVDDVKAQTIDLTGALLEIHKEDAKHIDKLVETALGQFIQKVAPSLEALSNANQQFVTEVKSSTGRVQSLVHAGVTNVELAVNTGVTQIQSELASGANALSASFAGSTRTIQTGTVQFTDMFLKEIGTLESNLRGVSKQIAEIRIPADIVEKTVTQQLQSSNARLNDSIKAFQEVIEHLSKQVRQIRAPADLVENAVAGQFEGTFVRLNESAMVFKGAIEHLSKQMADIRVPRDIVEKTVAQQVATVTASLVGSTRSLETAIKQLERSVLSVGEHVRTVRRRPWWQFWG